MHMTQAETTQILFPIPVTALQMKAPAEGLPVLQDWLSTAANIYALGFESFREAVELKGSNCEGKALDFGAVEVAKGFTRMSILLFGILWTYIELQKDWESRASQSVVIE